MEDIATAPLSKQQAHVLRNLLRHPDCSHRYDLVSVFRVSGELDLDCLEGAVGDLVARHAALRTVIGSSGSGWHQEIRPPGPVPLVRRDWPAGTEDSVVGALMDERHGTDAVLSGVTLFRSQLHRIGAEVLLTFMLHHLVYDGWSLTVLWGELSEFYASRLEGRPPVLPESALSYAEFAREQHERPTHGLPEAAELWSQMLDGTAPRLDWPAPRPSEPMPLRLASTSLSLPDETRTALRATARKARVTPAAVLVATTAAAAARLTGQQGVLVSTDTANRSERRMKTLVGHCVNSRIAWVQVGPNWSPAESAREVWRQWAWADSYRMVYSDDLVQALGEPPLFHVNINGGLVDGHNAPQLPGAQLEAIVPRGVVCDWRGLSVAWDMSPTDCTARLVHQRARFDEERLDEFGRLITEAVL